MTNLKRFENQVLNTMDDIPEYAHLALNARKQIIKKVWKHLNKKVSMKGGGSDPRVAEIAPEVQSTLNLIKLMTGGMTAYGIGKAIIPFLL